MGQDYRHLALLSMAVFLALGLGILLGGAVLGPDFLATQQDKAISQLTAELGRVRQSLAEMAAAQSTATVDLEAERSFSRAVLPLLVRGRLEGVRLAVVLLGDDRLYGEPLETLGEAGAVVTSVTTVPHSAVAGAAASAALAGPRSLDAESVTAMAAELSGGVAGARTEAGAGNQSAIEALARSGRIKFTGSLEPVPQAIVVMVEERAGAERAAVLLGEVALTGGLQVVVGAPAGEGEALLAARRAGLSTVEGVDQAYGRVALVLTLSGQAGNFGRGPASDSLIPLDGLLDQPATGGVLEGIKGQGGGRQ